MANKKENAYTRYVRDLARYYRRSPELISYEEVTGWLYHLIKERQLSASSVNIAVSAVNKCQQREKRGHWSGAAICDGSNIHNFAAERALFNSLDSDCGFLTELNLFQLAFIEICNHPPVVSDELQEGFARR